MLVLFCCVLKDFNMPVGVVVCETTRESDGVAMSSRNAYMAPEERAAAPVVYLSLQAGAEARKRAADAGRCVAAAAAAAAAAAVPHVAAADTPFASTFLACHRDKSRPEAGRDCLCGPKQGNENHNGFCPCLP